MYDVKACNISDLHFGSRRTIIFGSVAYLGSFSLKSAVTTAGNDILIVSNPPSISLVTYNLYREKEHQ